MRPALKNNIQIFLDCARLDDIRAFGKMKCIRGFTTNPTLMRHAGVRNYRKFVSCAVRVAGKRPICFEVISDRFSAMFEEAKVLSAYSPSVYVKIPVSDSRGRSSAKLVKKLSKAGIPLNVTAIMTLRQLKRMIRAVRGGGPVILSVFAGRIADTGIDPVPVVSRAVRLAARYRNIRLLWASPREVLNVLQAAKAGCHIITLTPELLKKINLFGRNLTQYSIETVKMFLNDARASGLRLTGGR